jgi:hypothetical protein
MYPMPDAAGYLASCATKSAEELAKAVPPVLSASNLKGSWKTRSSGSRPSSTRKRTWRAQDGEKDSDREGATQSALEASVEAQSEPGAEALEESRSG